MFIYETKKIYGEGTDQKQEGVVFKAGDEFLPAQVDETVLFVGQSDDGIYLEPEFVVVEEPHPYIDVYYNGRKIGRKIKAGETIDPNQGSESTIYYITCAVDTNMRVTATSSNDLIPVRLEKNDLDIGGGKSVGPVDPQTAKITVLGEDMSFSFNVILPIEEGEH